MRALVLCIIPAILLLACHAWADSRNACDHWKVMTKNERIAIFMGYNSGVRRGCVSGAFAIPPANENEAKTGNAAIGASFDCIQKYSFPTGTFADMDNTSLACTRITGGQFSFDQLLDCVNQLRRKEITLDEINACVGNK